MLKNKTLPKLSELSMKAKFLLLSVFFTTFYQVLPILKPYLPQPLHDFLLVLAKLGGAVASALAGVFT